MSKRRGFKPTIRYLNRIYILSSKRGRNQKGRFVAEYSYRTKNLDARLWADTRGRLSYNKDGSVD